jgi:hypothetical protein
LKSACGHWKPQHQAAAGAIGYSWSSWIDGEEVSAGEYFMRSAAAGVCSFVVDIGNE